MGCLIIFFPSAAFNYSIKGQSARARALLNAHHGLMKYLLYLSVHPAILQLSHLEKTKENTTPRIK